MLRGTRSIRPLDNHQERIRESIKFAGQSRETTLQRLQLLTESAILVQQLKHAEIVQHQLDLDANTGLGASEKVDHVRL